MNNDNMFGFSCKICMYKYNLLNVDKKLSLLFVELDDLEFLLVVDLIWVRGGVEMIV